MVDAVSAWSVGSTATVGMDNDEVGFSGVGKGRSPVGKAFLTAGMVSLACKQEALK